MLRSEIDNIIKANPNGISISKIAEIRGVDEDVICKTLIGAMDKILMGGNNTGEFFENGQDV